MESWLSKVKWSHGPIWPKLSVVMHYLYTWFCLFSYNIIIITIQEICQCAETDSGKRNFFGGEKVLNAGHSTTCGKVKNDYDANNIKLFASCIRSSGTTTNEPHKIHGQILARLQSWSLNVLVKQENKEKGASTCWQLCYIAIRKFDNRKSSLVKWREHTLKQDFTSLIFVAFFHATNTSFFSGLPK